MREILFRGRAIYATGWYYGDFCQVEAPDNFYIRVPVVVEENGETVRYCDWIDIDPETIGQYTGFTDVNGQKIFEGDIVERAYSVNRPKLRMYVVNHKGSWRLWSREDDEDFLTNWCSPHSLNGKDIGGCIVVGNIHDNPELVTGSTLASSSDGVF